MGGAHRRELGASSAQGEFLQGKKKRQGSLKLRGTERGSDSNLWGVELHLGGSSAMGEAWLGRAAGPRAEEAGVEGAYVQEANKEPKPRGRARTLRNALHAGLEMESSGVPGVRASSAAWMKGARPRGRRTGSAGGLLLWGGKRGRGRKMAGGGRRAGCVRWKLGGQEMEEGSDGWLI
jgi:hypothetical protein